MQARGFKLMPDHYFRLRPFLRLFETGWPVLLYHKIGNAPLIARRRGLFVSIDLLSRQLAELSRAGFRFGTLGVERHYRQIVITFDDGYASCFEHGMAVLEDFGCKAIQFLVSGRIGKTNDWDATGEPIVHKSQVRDWLANGHLIGSHTITHPDLTKLRERDAREEIMASRKWLEDTFGVAVNHFAYPFGACDERLAAIVRESGYVTAVTTEFGVNDNNTNPYRLRRILAYRSLRELLASAIFSRSE
jgi:peptidoglycan/xylan/chitin deacetylase (PgdA/CDA1 family)